MLLKAHWPAKTSKQTNKFIKCVRVKNPLTLNVQELDLCHVNRFDPVHLGSNSVAGLRSNLFATQPIIPHQKQTNKETDRQKKQTYKVKTICLRIGIK